MTKGKISRTEKKDRRSDKPPLSNRAIAASSYLAIGIIINYTLNHFDMPKTKQKTTRRFLMFHAKQATRIYLFFAVAYIIGKLTFLAGDALIIPFASLFLVILGILGMIDSLKGNEEPLPIISDLQKRR